MCVRVTTCSLAVSDWAWPLEITSGHEIDRHWQVKRDELPALFNGPVLLLRDYAIADGHLSGTLFKTDFKTLLYWRSMPASATDTVREIYGASLIRSAEGCLLFGRQGPGQLNSGRIYPPSGIIDDQDVAGNAVDIDASTARELVEETGLVASNLERAPGYLVAFAGLHVAVGIEWRSDLSADELRRRILHAIEGQDNPELDDIVIVGQGHDVPARLLPPHAQLFMRAFCDGDRPVPMP